MKTDQHIHSRFSCDSSIDPEELVVKALDNNYRAIAFTDHYDLHPIDRSKNGLPDMKAFRTTVTSLREKHDKRLSITCGIEFSEPHRYPDELAALIRDHAPDVLIASLHRMPDTREISVAPMLPLTDDDLRSYYTENLAMVQIPGVTILGHLGIFERYGSVLRNKRPFLAVIDEIFDTLIAREIALEVNYSGLRKPIKSIIPEPALLQRYYERGGRLLTIGSDAHQINDFNVPYEEAVRIVRSCGFSECYYFDKKWIAVPL